MTVREFLDLWITNLEVKVFQKPIEEIDKGPALVHRQTGDKDTIRNSNQNYLDFEVRAVGMDDGAITICCKANAEQSAKIIEAHKKK